MLATNSVPSPSSETEKWPGQFYVQHLNQRPLLREVHEWVRAHPTTMCMFMPDRLANSTTSKANEELFKHFTDHLMQTQTVSSSPRSRR